MPQAKSVAGESSAVTRNAKQAKVDGGKRGDRKTENKKCEQERIVVFRETSRPFYLKAANLCVIERETKERAWLD